MPRSLPTVAVVAFVAVAFAGSLARADDAPATPAAPGATEKPADPVLVLVGQLKDDQAPEVRLAACKEALTVEDPRVLAPLSKLLHAPEEDVRLAATAALAARTTPESKRRAATALVERSKALQQALEKDLTRKAELMATIQGLHDLAQEASVDPLLDGIDLGVDLEIVGARAMAVANIPSPKAIEGLIDFMGRRHRDGTGIRAQLTKALTYATGVKGGNDPDTWRAWWKAAKVGFDFEAAAAERAKARAAKDERTPKKKDAKEKRKGAETPKDGTPKEDPKKPSDA